MYFTAPLLQTVFHIGSGLVLQNPGTQKSLPSQCRGEDADTQWLNDPLKVNSQGLNPRLISTLIPFLPQSPFLPTVDALHPTWVPFSLKAPMPELLCVVATNSSQLTQKAGQPPPAPTLSPGGANCGCNSCSKAPGGVRLTRLQLKPRACLPSLLSTGPCFPAPLPESTLPSINYMHSNLSQTLFLGNWTQDAFLLPSYTFPSTRYSYPIPSPLL